MKKLLLLRHAQAAHAHHEPDILRPLTPKGLADARACGRDMAARGLQPDLILCSNARRTQETCTGVREAFASDIPTHILSALYDARRGDLLRSIQETDGAVETLLLIGHNPAVYELSLMLGGDADMRLMQGYPPATLSVFDMPCENWADIDSARSALTDLLGPEI